MISDTSDQTSQPRKQKVNLTEFCLSFRALMIIGTVGRRSCFDAIPAPNQAIAVSLACELECVL